MSVFWAYVEDLAGEGEIGLPADEAKHLGARRLRLGDALVVFDGAGTTGTARVTSLAKRDVRVEVETIARTEAPRDTLVVASAIPKGDRLSTMLQMMTQLGVGAWQPLVLEQSVVRSIDPDAPRLRRILVESAKVARRPWLLEVAAPVALDAVLAELPAGHAACFGDREGSVSAWRGDTRCVFIGPEAGFTENERRAFVAAEVAPVRFAGDNLRIETAAVAAAAVHFARSEDAGSEDG